MTIATGVPLAAVAAAFFDAIGQMMLETKRSCSIGSTIFLGDVSELGAPLTSYDEKCAATPQYEKQSKLAARGFIRGDSSGSSIDVASLQYP